MAVTKGFKAFNKGLICNNFQYKEGETYELKEGEKIELCQKGFHYCDNPLDVFDYYDITSSEFAEVEALGDIKKDTNKSVTSKIKIGVKLDLKSFMNLSIKCLIDICKSKPENITSGDSAKNASSGDSAKNASSGYSAKNASSGNSAKNASSGNSATNASSGDYATNASSGDYATNASSGDYAKNEMTGNDSVSVSAGANSIVKGKKGCFFCLTEWKDGKPIGIKSTKIDGKRIKADVWYKLENNKFVECK